MLPTINVKRVAPYSAMYLELNQLELAMQKATWAVSLSIVKPNLHLKAQIMDAKLEINGAYRHSLHTFSAKNT